MNQESIMKNHDKVSDLLRELKNMSVLGLTDMFDQEKQLFCYRVKKDGLKVYHDGCSLRYTIISLLGLHRLEAQGNRIPFDIQSHLRVLLKNVYLIDNIGDLGLLIWLCALVRPALLDEFLSGVRLRNHLECFSDARQGKTTELAWLLTGLSYAALAHVPTLPEIKDITTTVYEMIKGNYGHHGIFGHQKKDTLLGRLRGRIGSFADQVYPIYGFSKFAKAYDHTEALQIATECGKAICRHQGAFGQWWWHYDANNGNVIGRYPVFSVHQHSMAPMALFALSEISGCNFIFHIYKGLKWITGNNELGINLVDYKRNVIWRSLYRRNYKMRFEELSSLMHIKRYGKDSSEIRVLYESRPYCLGWLLYAFADKVK
jgi:hypothetical protein